MIFKESNNKLNEEKTSYLLDSINAKRFTSNISYETALTVVANWRCCRHKLKTYCSLKTQFGMENYVRGIPQSERRHFTKLKISAHHLSIERGRYTRPITPRSQRYCSDCKEQAIGDEFHFLLKCPKFAWERRKMFEKFSEFTSIKNNGDDDTFITLMQHLQGDVEVARIVCAFVNECF